MPDGIGKYVGIAAGVVILCLLAACWWQNRTINGLHEDLDAKAGVVAALETAATAKDAAIDELRLDKAKRDGAQAERTKLAREIENRRMTDLAALKEATRDDPQTDAWAAAPVPAAVRSLLR